ncbi:serine/threonine-protein kinase Smg1 [Scaptodrosophila lebanonensis]|uniref:non-specific serine/threonine protein kinase n=1 Tax=Drosophila lebanonensis TaxID=7225 RepID=A0A6J2TZG7_DROLE|nr:serine/threonine-protein kinase Smg1 [Scaptodrosophila lebanonensis]
MTIIVLVLPMKGALPVGKYNADDEAEALSGINRILRNNTNSQSHYGSGNGNERFWYAPKSHDSQAQVSSAASEHRNNNNDMMNRSNRKSYQSQMQYGTNDRDQNKLFAGHANSEDFRMTKIIRRLHNETNTHAALELCSKLDIAVRTPLNIAYMSRSFESILDSILSLIKQSSPPVIKEVSKTLGLIGYLNRAAFPIYDEFISTNYRAITRLQQYFILALKTTLSYDTKCDLNMHSDKVMMELKDFLENTESADNFIAISSTIAEFSLKYRHAFERHFTDVVDIIIGWQLEVEQPKELRAHCTHVLEQLTPYFSKQMDFSYGLLEQFIEDILSLDTPSTLNSSGNEQQTAERMGAFLGAFNSLLKCLARMQIFIGMPTCESIVSTALNHLTKILPDMLSAWPGNICNDALININELLCICVLHGFVGLEVTTLSTIIELEFEQLQNFNEQQKLSTLYLLLCVVRKLRARLPAALVKLVFHIDNPPQSEVHKYLEAVKINFASPAHRILLRICQETLLIKNVPLLQQAYKHLVQDIDTCMQRLQHAQDVNQKNSNCEEDSGALLIFHLSALASLAKQTSSIIGMYACNPSILELLITNCRAADLEMWSQYGTTHNALLHLLVVHCQKNHNFRTTSNLLRENVVDTLNPDHTSPTANSFATILKFLAFALERAADMTPLNLKLLLHWTQSLLRECKDRAGTLMEQKSFVKICRNIAGMASKYAPLECGSCIQTVLSYDGGILSPELLNLYREASLQQLSLLDDDGDFLVHAQFAQIYAKLPLTIALELGTNRRQANRQVQRTLSQCSAIRDNVFRDFFDGLELTQQQPQLRALFSRSYEENAIEERSEKLVQCTRRCQRLAIGWLQFEAARYCVDQKLRTTLGKPQDTFLGFEAIIMKYARLLSGCAKDNERQALDAMSLQELTSVQTNMRMLLGFLDSLEKLIYNAAEGSAFALRPPEKPVGAFFRLNYPTCQSWFNRIRIGVVIIAMHSMQPELVIRYAQEILLSQKGHDASDSQAIVYLAWALICCKEPDSLKGLYVWARSKNGKSYQWIQHAAEQAAGQREAALAGYRSSLADDDLDLHTRQFVIAQLTECMHHTGQWHKAFEFKTAMSKTEDSVLNPFFQAHNSNMNMLEKLLARNERMSNESERLSAALHSMSLWPSTWTGDSTVSDSSEAWPTHSSFSVLHIRKQLESVVLQEGLSESPMLLAQNMQRVLNWNWRECLLNASIDNQHFTELTLLKHIVQKLGEQEPNPLLHVDKMSEEHLLTLLPLDKGGPHSVEAVKRLQSGAMSSSMLIKCIAWSQLLPRLSNRSSLSNLYLNAAISAREEGNQQTCLTMLEQYFVHSQGRSSLLDIGAQLVNNSSSELNLEDEELLHGYSEIAKCFHMQEKPNDLNSINVCAGLCLAIQRQVVKKPEGATCPSIAADLLLTLADWISVRSSNGLSTNSMSPTLQQLLDQLPECSSTKSHQIPYADRMVARLINASLLQRPNSEDALMAYGNWCYRWGKKIVDNGCVLTQADVMAINQVTGTSLDSEMLGQLVSVLNTQYVDNPLLGMDELEGNGDEVPCTTANNRDEDATIPALRCLPVLADKSDAVIEKIVEIWRRANANTYDYYKDAARAYFHYLSLKSCGGVETQERQQRFYVDDNNMVTTTLRLLRLIVKHASGLQDVLEQGLKTTPIEPWKVIIPQLFSRLNHHEPYVRKSVCALLCRIAESRPQLVIFPAVVGANREQQTDLALPPGVATSANGGSPERLSHCYGYLLGALSKQSPEVVQHVQLLVKELRRVCLLWDEYWIHSLAQIYNTYVGRVNAFATEFKPDDHEGKQNRFNEFRPQMLADLETVVAFTSRTAETSYERNFKRRFDTHIRQTLEVLRTRRYPEAWDKVKQLYHIFQQNMIRGTCSTLKMQLISPVLTNIGKMRISMPGVDLRDQNMAVHIERVDSAVAILPTKTKPKKVVFFGSNSQKYTFLFKGLEDLHLDERIMQFLSISNSIMACKTETPTSKICFKAHHYSVIPLGPQSGLISWVDGVTPLFSLYKKWQQRDAQIKQQQQKHRSPNAAAAVPSKRITDMFYNKLSPLLAKHNMKVGDPRRQWPLSALRQVFFDLSKETPSDLLSRELWCQASSPAEWRQSVRRYTMCMAVMSVIGYVIGLGDRHLDNVLINLSSGDIVHIDYNVCFEKGRTLRIPEKVPFRLTQNMVHALGITGIEGAFRLGCEYVLKVMRRERETLLTLLEAFVYDPLVDWTVNDDAPMTRRAIAVKPSNDLKSFKKEKSKNKLQDWDLKRQQLVNKLNQMQKFWNKYKMELQIQLGEIGCVVLELNELLTRRLTMEQQLIDLNKRSALINEIASLGTAIESHSFNSASQRYSVKRHQTVSLHNTAAAVQPTYIYVQHIVQLYQRTLDQTNLSQLNSQLIQFKLEGTHWPSDYYALAEVLITHLPAETLGNYENTRIQADELLGRLNDLSLQCVEHMQQYASVMEYYPEQQSRQNVYLQFYESFGTYLKSQSADQNNLKRNSLTVIEPAISNAMKLGEAETMANVWMRLNYQLHQATQVYESKKSQPTVSVSAALQALAHFGCNQYMLNVALTRTLDRATDAFSIYEQTALANKDDSLLQQQLQYLEVVSSMCQAVVEHNDQCKGQSLIQLNELQKALTALTGLRDCFDHDVPASIFKLFLLRDNHDELQRFCELGSQELYQRFISSQHDQESSDITGETTSASKSHEQHFFEALLPAYMHFQNLRKALTRLMRTLRLIINVDYDVKMKDYLELNLLKESKLELGTSCFFDMVIQTLNISQGFNVLEFSAPMYAFIHFVEINYIAGLVPLLSSVFYTGFCGTHGELEVSDTGDTEQLCESLFVALQSDGVLHERQRHITLTNRLIELQTLVATAHYWAYGSGFDSDIRFGHVISKQKLCAAIYENWQTLDSCMRDVELMQSSIEGQLSLLRSQKTIWNRNSIGSLLRNEDAQKQLTRAHVNVIKEVIELASALCMIECDTLADMEMRECQQLLTNIALWQEIYGQWLCSSGMITPVEEAIIELLDPEGPIDNSWLDSISKLLEDYTYRVQRDISSVENEDQDKYKQMVALVKDLQKMQEYMPRVHGRILNVLQSKGDQNGKLPPQDVQILSNHVRDCQNTLNQFFQRLLDFRKEVTAGKRSLVNSTLQHWQTEIQHIQLIATQEVDEFFKTVEEFLQNTGECDSLPFETFPHNKGALNMHEQKRNAYGVSVWKKIRMKLEGRDPDNNQRSLVAEQIDYVIREATNPDNLAVLYEGWTPWV